MAATLAAGKATILAISADSVDVLKRVHAREATSYGLLSDPDQATMNDYGALHPWLPRPGRRTVVVDPAGFVRGVFPHVRRPATHGPEIVKMLAELWAGAAPQS